MKSWEQVQLDAAEFMALLKNGQLFAKPYTGHAKQNYLVISDIQLASEIAADNAGDLYFDREDAFESNFPESFEWDTSRISNKLVNGNFFDISKTGFACVESQWTKNQLDIITETIYLDIEMVFKCYANEYFTELWKEILEIYMNNGFPCGWEGEYPQGRLVVYSNE